MAGAGEAEESVTIGDRISRIRRLQAKLTQEELAERSNLSVETIRKLEQNVKTSARMSTLHKIARALGVRTSALFGGSTGQPVARWDNDEDPTLLALRKVLEPAPGLGPILPEVTAPSLRSAMESFWTLDHTFGGDDYTAALAAWPLLAAEAHAVVDVASSDEERAAAARLLSRVYKLVGTILTQVRRLDLAHTALAKAVEAANATGDELVTSEIISSVCWLLLRQGRLPESLDLATRAAGMIEPSFMRSTAEHLDIWGWLLIRGASAAMRDNQPDRARELLDAAAAAAAKISDQASGVVSQGPAYWLGEQISPATVAMMRVEAAMVAGDAGRALTLAAAVPSSEVPSYTTRNRHFLDVAKAQVETRQYVEATATLLGLRRGFPAWMSHQRYAHDIVSDLIYARKRALTEELAELAEFVGVEL